MDWEAFTAAPEKTALARRVVDHAPALGLGRENLRRSSLEILGDEEGWKRVMPGGVREFLWLVSSVSDASMLAAFRASPAPDFATVINERFEQNVALKPFVRQVMHYDVRHPVQALARMQRTARAMDDSRARRRRASWPRLAALNLVYTALVFLWLGDRSPGGARTRRMTDFVTRGL